MCASATTLEAAVSPSIRRITIAIATFAVLLLVLATPAAAGGRPYTIDLTGANEVTAEGVPNQGDPDGSGIARLRINPGQGEVCWAIEVSGVETIMMAHIHVGASTTTGPVVVPLNPYTGGCVAVERELALALITNPGGYYVNVHNGPYPAGALRGKLSR